MRALKKIMAALALTAVLAGCSADNLLSSIQGGKADTVQTVSRPAVESAELQFTHPAAGDTIAVFDTSAGVFKAVLFSTEAPQAVQNFTTLAQQGFYNGLTVTQVQDVLNRTTDAFRKDDLHLASKVEPLETVVDELVRAIKARHVARLQAGSCSIEYGFVLEDLLTNYERVCDHCSNVAVAQIEVAQDSFDTHAYLNDLRSGHASTKESEQFQRRLNRYRERYLFPDENVTETEDKQA